MTFNTLLRGLVFSTALLSANTFALIINHSTFIKNGGDINNIPNTLEHAYEPLRKQSMLAPFAAVGKIYACTATWLGDSPDGKKSYILTAAHCAEYKDPSVSSGRYSGQFRDRHDRLIAQDGVYYLGPYRVNRPDGFGGASTDIALLVLNKKATMTDDQGQPLSQPWLYDGAAELGQNVSLLGYGNWGTGQVSPQSNASSADHFLPEKGSMRAWGESYIDAIWEMDHGMSAPYQPEQPSKAWARLAPGDSGSAWWQQHQGFWTIVGVTNGGSENSSNAARVSQYVGWIKSLYPQVRTLSEMTTVTASQTLALPDLAKEVSEGSVTYRVPQQDNARGPHDVHWDLGPGESEIRINLQDINSGEYHPLTLRAWRDVGCDKAPMNSAVNCGNKQSPLLLKYLGEDNKALPSGHYKGSFYILAEGWHDKSYKNKLMLSADINISEGHNSKPRYPLYQPGQYYKAGDRVTDRQGNIYRCRNFPYNRFCQGESRFYAPGSGTHWSTAWSRVR
ncbi:trypsin-like serine protease [Rahnella sp. SAP-1]|uniref:Trypsin-like serine protease n=1 Tax=Rouxiella aceris TaxID=2703884 RepID=A0A848MKK8_9GAMM|nr:trypsin-like serine protease [Rouxiella aceris]NMP27669.1 trypsin-like serine protease [Rouxiella aceris]